jgi:hypothetical protein
MWSAHLPQQFTPNLAPVKPEMVHRHTEQKRRTTAAINGFAYLVGSKALKVCREATAEPDSMQFNEQRASETSAPFASCHPGEVITCTPP